METNIRVSGEVLKMLKIEKALNDDKSYSDTVKRLIKNTKRIDNG